MADTVGQADLRGLDIDAVAKGFADEDIIFKKYVTNSTTSAREIRWYQKTSGFLTQTAPATIANVSEGAQPSVLEQSWTRQTSYVRKYFVESPLFAIEDIKDSDPDVLGGNIRDLTRAIAYQVDSRIWDVMTESQSASTINSVTATAAWDAASGQDPIEDLMEAKLKIRENGYNPEGAELFLSSKDHKSLVTWLISQGASFPSFSTDKVKSGVVMEILGLNVIVSENVTAGYACVSVSSRAVTYKQFMPITAAQMEETGIGVKIRVWEEGEAILTDPKAVTLIDGTQS